MDSGSNIHLVSNKMAPTFLQKYEFSADDTRFDSSDGEKGGALGYHKLPGGDVYRNAKDGPRILSVFLLILQGYRFVWDMSSCRLINPGTEEEFELEVLNGLPMISNVEAPRLLRRSAPPGRLNADNFHSSRDDLLSYARRLLKQTSSEPLVYNSVEGNEFFGKVYHRDDIPKDLLVDIKFAEDLPLDDYDVIVHNRPGGDSQQRLPRPAGKYFYNESNQAYGEIHPLPDFEFRCRWINVTKKCYVDGNKFWRRIPTSWSKDRVVGMFRLLTPTAKHFKDDIDIDVDIPDIEHDGEISDCASLISDCSVARCLDFSGLVTAADGAIVPYVPPANSPSENALPHKFLHEPFDENCKTCRECRRIHAHKRKNIVLRSDPNTPLITFDLHGPITSSVDGKLYLGVCKSELTGHYWVEGVAGKAVEPILCFLQRAIRELVPANCSFVLHSDHEGAITSHKCKAYLASVGGRVHHGVVAYHNTNSLAESAVKTATNGCRTMMHASGIPFPYWSYAATTWSFLKNRSLSDNVTKVMMF